MLEIKSLLPTQKEKRLRKEARAATPIFPLKFKFLFEPAGDKEPGILSKSRAIFLKGKIFLPFAGELPLPTQACLKKGGCIQERGNPLLYGFSWLLPPAASYLYQENSEILKKISSVFTSWIDKNPPLKGRGWEIEEAVLSRAVVFPLLYDALKSGLISEKKTVKKIASSVLQHYIYVKENLKPQDWKRVLRLPALIFSGIFLRKFSMPATDFDLYLEEFLSFLHDEVDGEGIFRGNSVEEHLLFFEASLYTTLLLSRNKYLTGEAWERLERAARFLLELKSRDRILPLGGVRGIYLLPFHLMTRNPEFLISLLCSSYKSSRVGTQPVEGVDIFVKPVKGSYKPGGLCSKEASTAVLRNGETALVLSRMVSSGETSISMGAIKDDMEMITPDSGLSINEFNAPFQITECKKRSLEGIIGDRKETLASIKLTREGKEFAFSANFQKETSFSWDFILFPGAKLSIQDNVMEALRENSRLRIELPPGKRLEVDFIKDSGGISPRLRVSLKGPGNFILKFSGDGL